MDINALLSLAALCCKQGRKELALAVLEQACNCEEFPSLMANSVNNIFPQNNVAYGESQPRGIDAGNGNEGHLDGLDSYVDEVNKVPQLTRKVGGGVPESENTLNPSLHGTDSVALGQIISIASAAFAQKRYLEDGESLLVDPGYQALASSDELEMYDEHALSTKNRKVNPPLKPGRVRIPL